MNDWLTRQSTHRGHAMRGKRSIERLVEKVAVNAERVHKQQAKKVTGRGVLAWTFRQSHGLPIVLLLLAAGANMSPAGEPPQPDESQPGIEAESTAAVGQLIRLRATGAEAAILTWYVVPPTEDFEAIEDRAFLSSRVVGQVTITIDLETNGGHRQVTHVITVGEGPPEPNNRITAAMVHLWLKGVPEKERNETIKDAVTGETYTRQQAVGRTFSDVGSAAKALGSIRATNVMLTTGLAAAFGSEAEQWEPFAEAVDAALAAEEKRGITAAEYGKVLAVIGGALL